MAHSSEETLADTSKPVEDWKETFRWPMDTFGGKKTVEKDIARENPSVQKDNHGYSLLSYSLL